MSLFDEIQNSVIEKPHNTYKYRKILKEDEKLKDEKDLRKEMKEKLSPEEYSERYKKRYYELNKDKIKIRYQNKCKAKEAELWEILEYALDWYEYITDYNKYYLDKYKDDDCWHQAFYRFYWWYGRLGQIKVREYPKITHPIRIQRRPWLVSSMTRLERYQDAAYNYLKPHINNITLKDMAINKKQYHLKTLNWKCRWKLLELIKETDIPKHHLCNVASAMIRDKYISSEIYLGRVSFLLWDIIISNWWNVYRPILDEWIDWLRKDTVEEIHENRIKWLNKEIDDYPVYILRDAYLIKKRINEYEDYFYIVPTS